MLGFPNQLSSDSWAVGFEEGRPMQRFGLRDDQWELIKDFLPGREGHVGGNAADNWLFVDAVLYRYRMGIPWRDLPARFGDWKIVHQRFSRWAKSGVFALDDRFHETGSHGPGDSFVDSSFVFDRTRSDIMARWRQAVELGMTDEEIGTLAVIARSRSEAARRVERAQILLTYRENPSFFAVGQRLGVHHQTVQRCVERAMAYGPLAALDDRPRPGKEPTITPEAKAWLVSLACEKAKEHGYPHELWTTRLLARHA